MTTAILTPAMGESVVEATVVAWLKKVGDTVALDEPLVELETDKVTLQVNAPSAGVLASIAANKGETVAVGATLGQIEANTEGTTVPSQPSEPPTPARQAAEAASPPSSTARPSAVSSAPHLGVMPAAQKYAAEMGIDPTSLMGSGRDGRVLKEDVLAAAAQALDAPRAASLAEAAATALAAPPVAVPPAAEPVFAPASSQPRARAAQEERVRLSRLRKRIAERLKQAQNTAAMLTTFNEVDMSQVMALRTIHRTAFEKKHGVRLGFMSFFIRACVQALREIPAVNAEIDGEDIVFRNYYDIGVAVGTEQGLVVPVIRDADQQDFATLERAVADFGRRAREGSLTLGDLSGGTFTITNGGLYGSLMSTPILNPPQSGILGMHAIKERPVAIDGKVEIRPMMYLALSYDHRLIDGREAVTFLVRIKESLENPERLLLGL